jgi:Na+-translocating ferredoxin:NAD+ oxidoreductase RnfD subunit
MKPLSIKNQLIIFLGVFAIYLSIIDGNVDFLSAIFIAVFSAVFLDSIIAYLKTRRLIIIDSSLITGLIIGYVISTGEPWWKLLLASIFAIGSKHLIRIKGRHLFNPAAFGIFLAVILLGVSTQWRGTNFWFILVPAGVYFAWKIRKLVIAGSYIFSSLILFGVYAFVQKSPLLDVLKYQNYFFIFIMLIEPKTSPIRTKGKIIFSLAVAVLVFILTLCGVQFDAELFSLLVLNPFAPTIK